MDDRRFDSLTKSLAAGANRRSLLKGFLGLSGAAVAGSMWFREDASAARRPTPTPKPVTCPGIQVWDGSQCACPTGTKCGPDCCQSGGTCCDNACCYGNCYGEELCCPTGGIVCDGVCFEGTCCSDDECDEGLVCDTRSHTCVCQPDCVGKICGDDGCGGVCGLCGTDEACAGGGCFELCDGAGKCPQCSSWQCLPDAGRQICIALPQTPCYPGDTCPEGTYCAAGYCAQPCS